MDKLPASFTVTVDNVEDFKRVQEKLFNLGYRWNSGDIKVLYTSGYYKGRVTTLLIGKKNFLYGNVGMAVDMTHLFLEVPAEQVLLKATYAELKV